ncbi:SNF2-related protein [Arthrobacter bambusae]|uniref:SNF2-related protein n=1 Tax=Arthrobacter bambusae TaxID=1338426 RepID=UPI00278A5D9C|nr:SNF2-related protein [Arthrobacter bambusae]MDQ0031524.1 superfamily II DNA or RNA helicase [Arthrobacter bambusae]MDQ0099747.1 superfamily II DNA or RNA helicase [Arthrobacter bambusae]
MAEGMLQDAVTGETKTPSNVASRSNQTADSFTDVEVKGSYSPDDHPFDDFYLPMLARATSYDRAVGYWSAAELQLAAQGTARFLANGGRMRLIVGAQLMQQDVDAVLAGQPLDEVVAARLLADPEIEGAKIVEHEHLGVLAWMVANDRLEIRVGIPHDARGRLLTHQESGRYFHTKYGIFVDRHGNRVAFNGSNNASVTAWTKNHETFDVYPSWRSEIWQFIGEKKVHDFEKHWEGEADPGWRVIDLPSAVRQHLIEHAPRTLPLPPAPEDERAEQEERDGPAREVDFDATAAWQELVDFAQAPRKSAYTGVGTAWVQPLPHQAELINRVVSTFPRGYLFADEVGLGKTVEAGLVIRELFTSGRAKKALLLVPASVMKQWQEELHEKMNLDVPRFDRGGFLDRFDQPVEVDAAANPWSAFPIVLASSHLARRRDRRRQILDAGPWDIVLVDEAHHARRRGSKPTDTPNSLLALLLEMRDQDMWRALYLATATPMQMNAHEAWDLISLLGLKGKWGQQAFFFLEYFTRLGINPRVRGWALMCEMLRDYFSDPLADYDNELRAEVESVLGWVGSLAVLNLSDNEPSADMLSQMPNETSEWMDKWLRRHNPMRDRVFRNTRQTLREYQAAGIIPESVIIPYRQVNDEFIALAPNERKLYERIEEYIRRHYNAYKKETKQALGFIMTVYRRRLTSSFEAIRKSLQRRLDVLENGKDLGELFTEDDRQDIELFDPEEFDVSADRLRDEINELRKFLNELDTITGEDTKASQLVQDVNQALMTYDSIVVFTQYTDTMDYVRERMILAGNHRIGCYSGRGGEIYDHSSKGWTLVTKSDIKNRFRNGELTVLIGTDSMSEGLNLQTSGRLINYDMPWNLMRVEQRIGRIDRIGATYRDIKITNYFYADTVEEQVYKGIAQDYGDFTNIVGEAAPVLANVEKAIEQLAMSVQLTLDDVAQQVDYIRQQAGELRDQPLKKDDFGSAPDVTGRVHAPPKLVGETGLSDIELLLTRNALTSRLLTLEEPTSRIYRLTIPGRHSATSFDCHSGQPDAQAYLSPRNAVQTVRVTFNREAWDVSDDPNLMLLTYGTPQLADILPVQPNDMDV